MGACGGTTTNGVEPARDGGASSSGDSATPVSDGGASPDAAVDGGASKDAAREANVAECPGAFSPPPTGHCTIGVQCGYDLGACVCAGYCGGAAPPPDTDFSHWTCAPNRSDGCPNEIPSAGSACPTPGKACSYGDCCATRVTCMGGSWGAFERSCPP